MISTNTTYYKRYLSVQKISIAKHFERFRDRKMFPDFGYNMRLGAVNSSIIEGSTITMEAFEAQKFALPTMHTMEERVVADLYDAYQFASKRKIKVKNVFEAHDILSDTLLRRKYRGVLREVDVHVKNHYTGEVVYRACPIELLESVFAEFVYNLEDAIEWAAGDVDKAFFVASQAHFWFTSIHPFADGNGRMSRLLEKWVLAECLGKDAWKIPTEYMYRDRQKSYYKRLNAAGKSFEKIDTAKVLDFMLLLPYSLTIKIKR